MLKDLHLKHDIEKYKTTGTIDMREFICEEGGMWNTVEVWAQPFLGDCTKEKTLKKVSFLNFKKEHGESIVSDKCVFFYSKRDCDFIKKQIRIISPDIIIACSNAAYDGLKEVFENKENIDGKMQFNDEMSNYGEYFDISSFLDFSKSVYVVHYRHPPRSNIQGTAKQHNENMLKIRELILEK